MPPNTRHQIGASVEELLGTAEEFNQNELPTLRAVLRHGLFLQEKAQLEEDRDRRNFPLDQLVKDIRRDVVSLWSRANNLFQPPVIFADSSIERKIMVAWKTAVETGKGKKKAKDKDKFFDKLDFLFDIASCSCVISPCVDVACPGCSETVHHSCKCVREKKIPKKELAFMRSMREKRPSGKRASMMMSGNDQQETKRQRRLEERKENENDRALKLEEKKRQQDLELKSRKEEQEEDEGLTKDKTEKSNVMLENQNQQAEIVNIGDQAPTQKRNMMPITQTALAAVRYNVTNRQAAAVSSGFLHDLIKAGVVPPGNEHLAVDPKKLHRARETIMRELQASADKHSGENDIICLMVDARIDRTKVRKYNEETNKYYNTEEKEEHYTMTDETGKYLGHFTKETPDEDSNMTPSESVAHQIFDWCVEYGVDETLNFIAGDSTNSNTGHKGGVFFFLEQFLNRRLFWLVCQLHTNELKLRRLINITDGKTNSKDGFTGDLGKMLPLVSDMERNFSFSALQEKEPVVNLDEDIVKELSTDQKYSHRIMKAIHTGNLDMDLACMSPGTICHSRWLTTANTFCLMWVSKHGLKGKLLTRLRDIVSFIVQVYYPCWFKIKVCHSWVDGPDNVLYELSCLRTQKKSVRDVVEKVVRSSAWFAHSECVLITMLCSNDVEERSWAVDKILFIRDGGELGDKSPRPRKLPLLNLQAETLVDLIDWEGATEPVLTSDLTKEELDKFRGAEMKVPYLCNHTQGVERAIKEVTEASAAVYGADRRDGFIRGRAAHRELMPRLNSKQDLAKLKDFAFKK